MTKPLVSVIVPTFNRSHLLQETVESIFHQTYRPIELIIIDDGSTDDTPEVCRQLEETSRQHSIDFIYKQQINAGVSTARNTGTSLSKGEYVQHLDSDDLLHPQKLEIQVEFLTHHPACGLCISDCVSSNNPEQHKWESTVCEPIERPYTDYSPFTHPPTPLALYRSTLLRKTPKWEKDCSSGEDVIFLFNAMTVSQTIGLDPRKLVFIRNHGEERLSQIRTVKYYEDRVKYYRLFWNIAQSTPNDYQIMLTNFLCPNILSCTKFCIARGYKEVTHDLIKEVYKLPLSKNQKKAVCKVQKTLAYPRIIARLFFRLGIA